MNKRKRLSTIEEEGVEEGKATDPVNDPMPFTCICFDGKFYTTDDSGFFIHIKEGMYKPKLYRCEVDPAKNVVFTFIRHLEQSEISLFDNINDVNVVKDISNQGFTI
jgi:hypothetical protein